MNEEHIYTFPNGIKINCSDIIECTEESNVDDDKIFIRHEIYYIDENGENKVFYY